MHPNPAATTQAVPFTGSPRAQGRLAPASGGAVLVVHADAALRRSIAKALEAAGFAVVGAECADAALGLASQAWAGAVLQTPVLILDERTRQLCCALRAPEGAQTLPVVQLAPPQGGGKLLAAADACLRETAPPEALAATLQSLVRAHRAEEQLRRQQADWHASQAQAQFDAHALRNPLNAILMSAQVLAKMPLPPAALRAVDAICRNAQAQAYLISDTLRSHSAPPLDAAPSDNAPH